MFIFVIVRASFVIHFCKFYVDNEMG